MKTFEFSKEGLNQAKHYKDIKGITKEFIKDNPEFLILGLSLAVMGISFLLNPISHIIAFKSGVLDFSEIAFKYIN